MQLTNRQKMAAGMAGLAVLALTIDRVFLAEGEAGAAAPTDASPAVGAANLVVDPRTVPAALTTITIPESTLATRLDELAAEHGLDPANVPDVLQVPGSWLPDDGAPERPEIVETADDKVAAQKFARVHQLTAVMAHGGGGYAVINGRSLRVGQTLDDFKLVSVGERSAVFAFGNARVVLELPGSDSGALRRNDGERD